MQDDFEIVPATAADIEAIARLESRSFHSPWRKEFFESEIVAGGRYNVVIKDGRGQLHGYLFAMYFIDEMHINKIAVEEEIRRQGNATKLMAACIEFAKQNKVTMISLEVRQTNQGAQDFYKSLGFNSAYLRPSYYPDGEAAIVMTTEW